MYLFYTLYHFSLAVFSYIFKLKNWPRYYYAGWCLFEKMTYSIPAKGNQDLLVALRSTKRVLTNILKQSNAIKIINPEYKNAIYDSGFKFLGLEKDYINRQFTHQTGYFISKQDLLNSIGFLTKCYIIAFIVIIIPIIFLFTLFSKRRVNISLLPIYICDCTVLLQIIKKNGIRKLYDFIPYENDSNILSLILMKKDLYIYKFPSPGPLKTHNKIIIADELCLSSQYQIEESIQFKNTQFVKKQLLVLPEYAFEYIYLYANKTINTPQNTIGYYSHGSWLRQKEGNNKSELAGENAEEILLTSLRDFIVKNPTIKLIIYPHPREMNNINKEKALIYYQQVLGNTTYLIHSYSKPTYYYFADCDLAITTYSTIMLERLFAGFKGLFFNYNINFPLPVSPLNNICCNTKQQLFAKLSSFLKLGSKDFFDLNCIKEYMYTNYPFFKHSDEY